MGSYNALYLYATVVVVISTACMLSIKFNNEYFPEYFLCENIRKIDQGERLHVVHLSDLNITIKMSLEGGLQNGHNNVCTHHCTQLTWFYLGILSVRNSGCPFT